MPPAPATTADPQVTPTSMPSPVMAPVAKPVAPVAQAKPIATPTPVAQPKPAASPISTTSMPSPQMIPSSTPAPKTPDISGYIKAAQAQGISSDDIYAHLKQLGYVDSTGAITTTKQAAPAAKPTIGSIGKGIGNAVGDYSATLNDVAENVGNTFEQGGENIEKDIGDMPAQARAAGSGIGADLASEAEGAGNIAGDVAGTTGGMIGDVISPLIPDSVKQRLGDASKYVTDKVNSIPGMTPEIAKGLSNVFNTLTLEGGGKAAEIAPAATETAIDTTKNVASDAAAKIKTTASNTADTVTDTTKAGVAKARDLVTPNPPKTMQTLIDSVKSDPQAAKTTADTIKKYIQTAKKGATTGGEDTATKAAGHAQFGKAMATLSAKLKASGTSMSDALKAVGQANVPGVNDVLENLKAQTADRIGAEYTPMSDTATHNEMLDMTHAQRIQYLNDLIDGKVTTPGEEGAFRPTEESGGQISVKDGPSLKRLGDLHETLNDLGDNPTVKAVHNVIQRWQEELYKTEKPGKVEGIMKNVIGQLNEKVKGATASIDGGKYADAKADFARQSEIKDHVEGLLGDDMKHSGTVMKRLALNNVTGNVNQYVKELEEETGIPIIDHATIANFADRLANNPQAQSLLESGKLGSAHKVEGLWSALKGFDLTKPIGSAANVASGAGKLISDPEGKIMRQLGQ